MVELVAITACAQRFPEEPETVGAADIEDCAEAERGGDYSHGVAPYALDPINAARPWDVSLQMLASAERG